MVRLFVQYLATNNNENFPNSIKNAKIGSKFCQTLEEPKSFKFLPQWRNFTKPGHTELQQELDRRTSMFRQVFNSFKCFF